MIIPCQIQILMIQFQRFQNLNEMKENKRYCTLRDIFDETNFV